MPRIARIPQGQVSGLWGKAQVRTLEGEVRALSLGAKLLPGETVLAGPDTILRIVDASGKQWSPKAASVATTEGIDALLDDLNTEHPEAATAAGAAGSPALAAGFRIDRIIETVTPLEYEYSTALEQARTTPNGSASGGVTLPEAPFTGTGDSASNLPPNQSPDPGPVVRVPAEPIELIAPPPTAANSGGEQAGGGSGSSADSGNSGSNAGGSDGSSPGTETPAPSPPTPTADQVTVAEDTPLSGNVLGNDSDPNGDTLSIVSFTIAGRSYNAGETAHLPAGNFSLHSGGQFEFVPSDQFSGTVPTISYRVSDGSAVAEGTVQISVLAVNDRPVAVSSPPLHGVEDMPVSIQLGGQDADGSIRSVTLISLPSEDSGTLYLSDGSTPVAAGASISPADAASLRFVPAPNFHGTVTLHYAVVDDQGAMSAPSPLTIQIADTVDPGISIANVQVNEGAGTVTYTVVLDQTTTVPVEVTYSTENGTAVAGQDYLATSGVLRFEPGQQSQTVTVSVLQDGIYEGAETVNLVLRDPVNGVITGSSAQAVIRDDGSGAGGNSDQRPIVTQIDAPVVTEGDAADFTVWLSNPSTSATRVELIQLAGTTTTASTDVEPWRVSFDQGMTFQAIEGETVLLPPNAASFIVRVPTVQDPVGEPDVETIGLMAKTAHQVIGVQQVGTVIDDDRPLISLSGPGVVDESAGTVTYTVVLSNPSDLPVSVGYATAGDSAMAGQDYDSTQGTLTFAPGEVRQSFTVAIRDDTTFEGREQLVVRLLNPSEATLNSQSSEVTTAILDGESASRPGNDDRPALTLVTQPVMESDGYARFELRLSQVSGVDVPVHVALTHGSTSTSDGFATLEYSVDGGQHWLTGSDFSISAGQTVVEVRAPVVDDRVAEDTEWVTLTATATSAVTSNASTAATMSLLDNDHAPAAPAIVEQQLEDHLQLGNLLTSATDGDGDLLTISGLRISGTDYQPGESILLPEGELVVSADGTYRFTPSANFNGDVASITLRVSDGANETETEFRLTYTPVNDGPVAQDDVVASPLVEDSPDHQQSVGNVLTASARDQTDSDVDGDPLQVVEAGFGNSPPATAVPADSAVGVTLQGVYGQLQLYSDGRYHYQLDNTRSATQNLVAGEVQAEVFTYRVSDGQATDDATLTIQVSGTADLQSGTVTLESVDASGLKGEYYGYNDTASANRRLHADDTQATFGGANLNAVEDLEFLINGRNAAAGSSADLVGSAQAAHDQAADARFDVRHFSYGFTPAVDSNLGANPATAAGAAITSGALFNFLGGNSAKSDAPTAVASEGLQTGTLVGVNTGLGNTTDSAIRVNGKIFLERGNYDFRVTADDGFRLRVAGETLLEFDGNQSPTSRIFRNVEISDRIEGLQDFELLYWEQGGNARLRVEVKLTSDTSWKTLSLDDFAMFDSASAPTIADRRVQDIVEGSANQSYVMRTGSVLDGGTGDDTLLGAAARDHLMGGDGNDHLDGADAADTLDGGRGDDVLLGGAGADILNGGEGQDRLEGGSGDDVYLLETDETASTDTIVELAAGGTDSVELGAHYEADFDLASVANVENASLSSAGRYNLAGTSADNRLTGGAGDNLIIGREGNDRIAGGQGNDTLVGDQSSGNGRAGADVFEWNLGDASTMGQAAIDHILDFNYGGGYSNRESGSTGTATGGGDRIDLRDLLVGEHSSSLVTGGTPDIGNLLNYIDVIVSGSGASTSTTLRISTSGGFSGGSSTDSATDQVIVLSNAGSSQGVDLYALTGAAPGNETDLLQRLLKNGTLIVD